MFSVVLASVSIVGKCKNHCKLCYLQPKIVSESLCRAKELTSNEATVTRYQFKCYRAISVYSIEGVIWL